MKNSLQLFGLLLSLLLISSCDKYDEGGSIKKASNNLTNVWLIDQYLLDGADKTSDLLISNYNETFADNGTYTRIYKDGGSNDVDEIGSWSLSEDSKTVNFSGGGAYDLTSEAMGVSASTYTILKLTKKKFWYSFSSGGSTHEFHMVPKS